MKSNMTIFHLSTLFFLSFSTFLVLRRTISRLFPYLSLIATHLKRALDASLHQAFFGHSLQQASTAIPLLTRHELGTSLCQSAVMAEGEAAECTICLCKIEPGDDIKELHCSHLFHGVCLDRWIGFNRLSCPLCRGSVAPWRSITELGEEVLFFKFCDLGSDSGGDRWWLR